MTIVKHELRRGKTALILWTASIGFLLSVCIFLFPEIKDEMAGTSKLFASMGTFTAAFGMDRLNFGTLSGFYAIECGNILGLGGAFYVAQCAASMLCKEEKEGTAEFLLTHPIRRARIVSEKLLAILLQTTAMSLGIYALSIATSAAIGEAIPWKEITLLHTAYWLLQLELAGVCFGLSAFLRRASAGVGIGLATMFYFLNLIANISETAAFLKYITPFAFCDGADVITNGRLDGRLVAIGLMIGGVGIAIAYGKYTKKDIL